MCEHCKRQTLPSPSHPLCHLRPTPTPIANVHAELGRAIVTQSLRAAVGPWGGATTLNDAAAAAAAEADESADADADAGEALAAGEAGGEE